MTEIKPAAFQGRPSGGHTKETQPGWDIVPAGLTEDSHTLEQIAGRPLKFVQVRAFELYCINGGDNQKVMLSLLDEGMVIAKKSYNTWRRSDWWKELSTHYYAERQTQIKTGIVAADEEALEAYRAIITGEFKEPKMANAAVQALKLRSEMSVGDGPLIDRRPNVNIQHNTQNNMIVSPEQLKGLSQEELLSISIGASPVPGIALKKDVE